MNLNISPNPQPYHAQGDGFTCLTLPDQKSVFKIYFISIPGRAEPERYEWARSPFTQANFLELFSRSGVQGAGFVIAFPHVTKIYRFCPEKETILDVSEHFTPDLSPRDLSRGDGFHEFACYAEAVLAADEYHAWAKAASVAEYLQYRSPAADFPVTVKDKLYTYWENKQP